MANEEKLSDLGIDKFVNFMHCTMDSDANFNKFTKDVAERLKIFDISEK